MHRVHRSMIRRPRAATLGLSPVDVAKAYRFPNIPNPSPVKIGIMSLDGAFSQDDITAAFKTYGLPAPNVTVVPAGGAMQSDPGGADVENMLDILCAGAAWAYCTGTPAEILFGAGENTDIGIADCCDSLSAAGAEIISQSWGSPESNWSSRSRAYTETVYQKIVNRGAWLFAASGDNSIDDGMGIPAVDYPCGSAYVNAIGGTYLLIGNGGSIAQEKAWGDGLPGDPGGGGGFDANTPKPSWQQVVPGSFRGAPDFALNADPESGYRVVANGSWGVVGGTSGAAPMAAGLFAVIRSAMKSGKVAIPALLGPALYGNPSKFNDIVIGSNGDPAAPGWDASTGLGSPRGQDLLDLFLGGVSTSTPTSPVIQPTPATVSVALYKQIIESTIQELGRQASGPLSRMFLSEEIRLFDGEIQDLYSALHAKGIF